MSVVPIRASERRLPSWVDGFMEYTEHIWSTIPFRRWAAICAVAGAIERKVWIRSQGSNVYPNLFVFIVGPPAAGKTRAVELCEDLWQALIPQGFHIAPVSLTKASLMDELKAAERTEHSIEPPTYNSLLIASKELGALIPTYDADFLNALTYIYDNAKYDEKRRGNKDHLIIERPQINLIGCTTPSFLLDTLPITAWDQGFLSRVIIIYNEGIIGERKLNFDEEEPVGNAALAADLRHDIQRIAKQTGKLVFTREAGECLNAFLDLKDTRPTHPRLQHYLTRRPIHLLKLSIIAAVDAGSDREITRDHAATATNWLAEAESGMPDLFLRMRTGGDAQIMAEATHFIKGLQVRSEEGAVPMRTLIEYLSANVPSYRVQQTIGAMKECNMIRAYTKHTIEMVIANDEFIARH